MVKLGVNIDHVATLRQARGVSYPDPLEAALAAQQSGADAITIHLREDRRHVQDNDLFRIRNGIRIHLNQELAPVDEMVELSLRVRPHEVCLVPERRQELTTEGGLDAAGLAAQLRPIIARFKAVKIGVSLFIDPDSEQIEAAAELGADFVELHTGTYATAPDEAAEAELEKIRAAVKKARELKLKANAGHGLNYDNVGPVAALPGIQWLHIGHSIVARSVMVGMGRAVREMKTLIARAQRERGPSRLVVPARRASRQ